MTEILYQNFSDQAIVVRKGEAFEKTHISKKIKKWSTSNNPTSDLSKSFCTKSEPWKATHDPTIIHDK